MNTAVQQFAKQSTVISYLTLVGLPKLNLNPVRVHLWRVQPQTLFDISVNNTISGGTPKRTGTMLVPIPVVTKRS
jgi:hypothetical protein